MMRGTAVEGDREVELTELVGDWETEEGVPGPDEAGERRLRGRADGTAGAGGAGCPGEEGGLGELWRNSRRFRVSRNEKPKLASPCGTPTPP